MTTKDPVKRREYNRRYYESSGGSQYQQQKKKEYIQRNQDHVNQIKAETPCADCGTKFRPCQMDFDHLRDKESNIAILVRKPASIATIEAEMEKCELVCSNCHRLRTYKRLGL